MCHNEEEGRGRKRKEAGRRVLYLRETEPAACVQLQKREGGRERERWGGVDLKGGGKENREEQNLTK